VKSPADYNELVLDVDSLRITVNPNIGGTIVDIWHKDLKQGILGSTPWDPILSPIAARAADEMTWLTRYRGGWPLLFPNGGDTCEFNGVLHGYHGEASVSPWAFDIQGRSIRLRRQFFTVPVVMDRELQISGDVLIIKEAIAMVGKSPIEVMWTHHPTFGGDLLGGGFVIETGAKTVVADDQFESPLNPLERGATGSWPLLPGKNGLFDMSVPEQPIASMTYLLDFKEPWVSVRRSDYTVGVALSWDLSIFPCAWLWYELEGTYDPPWFGNARLLGIEPSTSWPGTGLADIKDRGGPLLILSPGDKIASTLRLHVFKPDGIIEGVDHDGRAITG
tara:strand:+ start:2459 stop:3460 length:1002 start_codon:yes stop_codon:yes gene_type:complete